jgi:hypothetical protein
MNIEPHRAVDGVTGSCHQLTLRDGPALLIDYSRTMPSSAAKVPAPTGCRSGSPSSPSGR